MNQTIDSNASFDERNMSEGGNRRLYKDLLNYTRAHTRFTYGEFEQAVLRDVCLFNVPDDRYMQEVEDTLDAIIKALREVDYKGDMTLEADSFLYYGYKDRPDEILDGLKIMRDAANRLREMFLAQD